MLPLIAVCFKIEGISSFVKVWQTAKAQLGYSFLFAFSAAIVTTFLGWILAKIQLNSKNWKQWLFDFVLYLPFVTPGTLMGIGYILIWNRPGMEWLSASMLTVPVIFIGCFTTIMQKSIFVSYSMLHPALFDAAKVAPRSFLKKFYHIELPLINRGIVIGFLAVFIFSFRELNATVLTLPPGIETIALRTYTLSHYGADDMVMVLCLIFIIICILLYFFAVILLKKFFSQVE